MGDVLELIGDCSSHDTKDVKPTIPCNRDEIIEAWPSLAQCECSIKLLRKNKAGGLDGIPPEIYLAAPHKAAEKIFPMLAKQAARGTIPFRHKKEDWRFLCLSTKESNGKGKATGTSF